MSPKTSESAGAGGGKSRSGLVTPTRVSVVALALLALIFIFENTRSTRIRLLIPEVTMPLWMALLGTAVIGALCGAYFMRRRR
ncbi:LapA family protein [Streptomyces sp. NPDC093544]|jgi:uncharacterized integral membrane protein|uniref:LapA family protein n=1 Tax=Streptomyces sp. NPDC093544 TaxID=3155200 RepID=UPI00343D965A